MEKIIKNNKIIIILLLPLVLLYIFWNTGIHGDEFFEIIKTDYIKNPNDFFKYTYQLIHSPINHLLFWWVYPVLSFENLLIYDLLKVFWHLVSIICVYKFASDYLPNDRAFLASLLFLFYPTHDTSSFCYMFVPYTVVPAVIMLCHHLYRLNKILLAYPLLLIASFASYLTPPYIIGLGLIFFLEKSFKKFFSFISVSILYLIYYFSTSIIFTSTEKRIDDGLSLIKFIKHFILQIISGIDVFIGPSFFLKIFWSNYSIQLISFILSLIVIFFLSFGLKSKKTELPKQLFFGLLAVFFLSCGMFALTGYYTQIAFNLGNRVTIYGSLLVAFYLATLPFNKKYLLLIFFIFIMPIFGLSDHWKEWNKNQKNIFENIQKNQSLKQIKKDDLILVEGNFYSKLGPFENIEFFSIPSTTNFAFKNIVESDKAMALLSYVYIDQNKIIDGKYNTVNLIPTNNIYLYDSTNDVLKNINKLELESIIK